MRDIQNMSELSFTRNWFRTRNMETFDQYVLPEFADKPITYLELGVYERQSLVWMLQNVLTHPDARAVAIDPWLMTEKMTTEEMEDVMLRAHGNVQSYRVCEPPKCTIVRANSAEVLRRMLRRGGYLGIGEGTLDLAMVDGNHTSLAVFDDALLVFRLLKPGGIMLFDDVVNTRPKTDHVRQGLDMFLAANGDVIQQVWQHKHMEGFRKI